MRKNAEKMRKNAVEGNEKSVPEKKCGQNFLKLKKMWSKFLKREINVVQKFLIIEKCTQKI